ncbi:MAG TPA: winged helix-turn-helix domain-containing protein [Bryobacteraceae bacterium]
MNYKSVGGGVEETGGRLWRFDRYEFDELRRSLRVDGHTVDVEAKPLDILLQLLMHAGEVVTKEELLESVWPGVMVVDGSLATAVSKLRKAMGDETSPAVVTVPRVGYRMAVPVFCKSVAAPPDPELYLQPEQFVPGREQWQLVRALEPSGAGEVWIARNPRTHEQRVFKFASDGIRLKGLKREVTIARFLRESLADRPEFVRILEWNFDTLPYFIESEYAGPNLAEWSETQGGLAGIPAALRLQLLIDIVHAVAAAQGIGVLHKDLKPANILVTPSKLGSGWQIKIADFGSASLFDPSRLQALGITNLGFTRTTRPDDDSLTGTLMYLAPEVLGGETGSASSDVYALGVLLYQLLVGDFRRPLAPGWEDQIHDPLLREDVAAAAAGDPARRLSTAAELADRLQSLDERRARRDELDSARLRAQRAERRLAESRARRPWIVLALVALVAGLAVSLILYQRARRERDYASRQTAIASSINQFLSDDLLGRSNPFLSGKASESLTDAIKQASPSIDSQFSTEPLIAARLHQTIARALDNRTDYADALPEYERAAALFRQVQGPSSQDAIIANLQRVTAVARSYQKDSQPLAKSILASQEKLIAGLDHPRPELQVWVASARGMIALIDNNAAAAAREFQMAVDRSRVLPMFDQAARLTFQQRLGFCYIRLGQGAKAEETFRFLIAAFTDLAGPESPNVLRVRLNLAQAFMIENKFEDAVRETTAVYPDFVARLGPDHELTMQLLSTRAQSEGSLGLWKDTVRDDMTIYNIAVQKQGARSFFAVATLSDASLAMCRSGNFIEGESNARKAYDDGVAAFGPRAGLTGGTASTLAACLIGRNRLDEASRLLSGIDVAAVAQLTGDPNTGAGVTLLQAEIAYRQKDFGTARKDVDAIKPVFTRADAEPYQRRALEALASALQLNSPH